jgi:hypothetical protein
MDPYDRVIAALKAHGSHFRGGNWTCPAHEDRTPSLSVNPAVHAETGLPTVILNCHAGCATIDEILPVLGLQSADLFTGNGQMALFSKSRYSPVGLEILLKLPRGSERSFIVASALGRYVDRLGGRRHVSRQREIAAVILEAKHRRAIERELQISSSRLRNHIVEWRKWGVAHGCPTGVVTILVREAPTCPVCGESVTPAGRSTSKSVTPAGRSNGAASRQPDALRHGTEATMDGFFKGVDSSSSALGTRNAFGRDRSEATAGAIEGLNVTFEPSSEDLEAFADAIRPLRVITNHAELREALDRDYRESKEGRA